MKKLLAFLILVSFSAQTFGQVFIVASYYFNTAAFAKTCENKDKPKLKCNGKCQMMKKLAQEEKKDKQYPERKIDFKSITLSSKSFFASAQSTNLTLQIFYSSFTSATPIGRMYDVFHPPQAGTGNLCCI